MIIFSGLKIIRFLNISGKTYFQMIYRKFHCVVNKNLLHIAL